MLSAIIFHASFHSHLSCLTFAIYNIIHRINNQNNESNPAVSIYWQYTLKLIITIY